MSLSQILREGKQTKAADVYAFGITLWEVFTGSKAYKGIPQMVLGHKIVFEHLRPAFPEDAPSDFRLLAEKCWHPDMKQRPAFDDIFNELRAMRDAFDESTLPLRKIDPQAFRLVNSQINQEAGLAVARFAPLRESDTGQTDSIVANSEAAAYQGGNKKFA